MIKIVNSTDAQNNFGQLLDDVAEKGTRYVVRRFGKAKAVVIPLDDFRRLCAGDEQADTTLRECSPGYALGEPQEDETIRHMLEATER